MRDPRTIVAMGGGGFSMEPDRLAARRPRPGPRARGSAVATGRGSASSPTASGDARRLHRQFYAAFARTPRPPISRLFDRTVDDIEAFLLDQDVIYVGGGNTANMLAIWRVHGVDRALRRAWEAGVVLTGLSAGSICWFEAGRPIRSGRG